MLSKKSLLIFSILLVLILAFAFCMNVGAKEKVVKIGFIGPLTGPNAAQGVGAKNSFDLAVKLANESGDFDYKIEVVAMDDASNPGTGASAAMKLLSDPDVVVASGHWNSPVANATIPIFKDAGVPLVIWGAIGGSLTSAENYPTITRVCPTLKQENIPLAKFIMDDLGYKKWSIISDTSTYGKNNTSAWTSELKQRNDVKLISLDEVQVGQTDFKAILSKIKSFNPDAVYFGGVVMEAALIRRQMNDVGMGDTLLVGISGIADDKFIEVATPEIAEGTICTTPGKTLDKLVKGQEFMKNYEKFGYKEPYGAYGQYAYDAANVILQALKEVGPDSAKLIEAIPKVSLDGLLGVTTFNEIGQTNNTLSTILVVDDGVWVDYNDSNYKTGKKSL